MCSLPKPLALFNAERVDLSLARLGHYTGTSAQHFQRFILFTNYQRYVDEFLAYSHKMIQQDCEWEAVVEPGDVVTPNRHHESAQPASGNAPNTLPQVIYA